MTLAEFQRTVPFRILDNPPKWSPMCHLQRTRRRWRPFTIDVRPGHAMSMSPREYETAELISWCNGARGYYW